MRTVPILGLQYIGVIGVLIFEKIIGYPFISTYLLLSFTQRISWWQKIPLLVIFSIFVSMLYGISSSGVFVLLWLLDFMVKLRILKSQKVMRIVPLFLLCTIGFGVLGFNPGVSTRVFIYGFLQIVFLFVVQYQLKWRRGFSKNSLSKSMHL